MENTTAKNSPARIKANAKYTKSHYERIALQVKKGEREYYKDKATELGYDSLNSFIIASMNEKIERS